jgi:glycosyltransferase involved in cell wall biosynthesis
MKIEPRVTIGLCARNAQNIIGHAIDSILAQDFPKESMEIIFVDDGSEDGTLSIMRNYASKTRIRSKIFGGTRIGLGKARNTVVWNAIGEYIIWVDADIVLPVDHVRKQVGFMEKNPKVAIAGARFYGLPEKDLLITLQNLEWTAVNYINIRKLKLNTSCAVCGGTIYRTEAIRQIGGFDTKVTGAGEDEELEWKISKSGWKVQKGTDTFFFEKRKKGWKAIWNQFFWYGYGKHYLIHKNITLITPSQLLEGLVLSVIAYRLTRKKVAFLLPIQYYFKRIAWFFGFSKAHLDGYGHGL